MTNTLSSKVLVVQHTGILYRNVNMRDRMKVKVPKNSLQRKYLDLEQCASSKAKDPPKILTYKDPVMSPNES